MAASSYAYKTLTTYPHRHAEGFVRFIRGLEALDFDDPLRGEALTVYAVEYRDPFEGTRTVGEIYSGDEFLWEYELSEGSLTDDNRVLKRMLLDAAQDLGEDVEGNPKSRRSNPASTTDLVKKLQF